MRVEDGFVSGGALVTMLEVEKGRNIKGIKDKMLPYEPETTFHTWHKCLLAIEELINVMCVGDYSEVEIDKLQNMPLAVAKIAPEEDPLFKLVKQRYGTETAGRIKRLLFVTMGLSFGFKSHLECPEHGLIYDLNTIGEVVLFYQSRRRYIVSLLYAIPTLCRGNLQVSELDALMEFMPVLETSAVAITSLEQYLTLAEIDNDFKLYVNDGGYYGSKYYNPLEALSLEPERVSLVDHFDFKSKEDLKDMELVPGGFIFSAEEFRNSQKVLNKKIVSYMDKSEVYEAVADLMRQVSHNVQSNYFLTVSEQEMKKLLQGANGGTSAEMQSLLCVDTASWPDAVRTYRPFIRTENEYVTNLNLMARFLYYLSNHILEKSKKFQINSGFVFEKKVSRLLAEFDFKVKDIKRINRKEFDIVTTLKGTIYNFQCKNCLIDLSLIGRDRKLFVRHNRRLVKYFEKAIDKEKGREKLLINKIGLDRIKHFVVSRFPVITDDARIMNYNELSQFAARLSDNM